MTTGYRTWIALPLALTLSGLVGCGGDETRDGPPPAAAERACPPDDAAGGRPRPEPYDPDGTPYAGAGPHLVTLIKVDPADHDLLLNMPRPLLPPGWQPPSEDGRYSNEEDDPAFAFNDNDGMHGDRHRSMVQLVVCEYLESTGEALRSCPYDEVVIYGDPAAAPEDSGPYADVSLEVVEARYSYEVYEATTAELVTRFQLSSSREHGYACPDEAPGDGYTIPMPVAEADITEELRPFVEEAARTDAAEG